MLSKLDDLKILIIAAVIAVSFFATAAYANPPGTGVFINGVELSQMQVAALYRMTGQIPARGHYLVANGCFAHLESGQVGCPRAVQGGYEYGGRSPGAGYGYYGGQGGAWFHRGSEASGGYSVGGDGNGCVYTPNWSNC
jgi:hypothetical protein